MRYWACIKGNDSIAIALPMKNGARLIRRLLQLYRPQSHVMADARSASGEHYAYRQLYFAASE